MLDGLEPSRFGFRFLLSPSGAYVVNIMRCLIDSKLAPYKGPTILWTNLTPLKVRCFVWRAMLNRISVHELLHDRGIAISSHLCVLCDNEPESVDNLLVSCSFAREVQQWIFTWCGFGLQNFNTVLDLIVFSKTWCNESKRNAVGNTVLHCYFWCLWLCRNDKVFKNIRVSPAKVADCITTTSYSWCKNRSSYGCGSWVDWSCSPYNHFSL